MQLKSLFFQPSKSSAVDLIRMNFGFKFDQSARPKTCIRRVYSRVPSALWRHTWKKGEKLPDWPLSLVKIKSLCKEYPKHLGPVSNQ